MAEDPLKILSDMASEAHASIQDAHEDINPVIGVRRGMRDVGIPADVMTIDCLRTRRRIMCVLHDDEPGMLLYQFTSVDEDVGENFERLAVVDLKVEVLFDWMTTYFSADMPGHPSQ